MINNAYTRAFFSLLIIVSLCLMNVNTVLADDPIPPTATPEPTAEPPVAEPTPTTDETPENGEQGPAGEDAADVSLFSQVPENTELVVLDENGEAVPLATNEAIDIILETDPMWCPAGVLPGGPGCTSNFASITLLINNMISNTNAYDQAGVIYFTSNPGASFTLTTTTLGSGDFNQLRDNNLVLQGGWNGLTGSNATFTGQTNFGTNSLTIGTTGNPWLGDITLNNFSFSGVSSTNAVTVYTTSGDIILNNVDVSQQSGGDFTANLVSSSGDITVQNGSTFDGDNTGSDTNQGFNASTGTGTITITGTAANPITFTDAKGNGTGTNYNGATLSAPVVILTYVTATENDRNGIYITNANTVTLNNVVAGNNSDGNGTNPPGSNNSIGSGVFIQGVAGGTDVNINGGFFANNERYGIEVVSGDVTIISSPTYGTGSNSNGYGTIGPNNAPDLNVPANMTVEATSSAGAIVTFSVSASDMEDNPDPAPSCNRVSGSLFPIATTTVTCTVTDSWGVTTTDSFTIRVRDTTGPALTLPANIIREATGANGAAVTYTASATDLVDGPRSISCTPASGSTFGIGTVTVNCWSVDTRFNFSFGSFTVSVRDTTPPVLNLPANIIVEATSAAGALVTYSATATDIVNGSRSVACSPASNTIFPLGTTTVNCSATDSANNTSTGSFTVTVQDTTGPALTLPANSTHEATSAAGATVTYSTSATDIVSGSVAVTCSPLSGSTFPLGTTTVNCSATDNANNTSTGSFTVTVQDTTGPALTLPANSTHEATSAVGATVTYSASATDIVSGSVAVTCSPLSGSTFPLGTTTINCSATDNANNTSTGSFTVTVQDTTAPIISKPDDVYATTLNLARAKVGYQAPSTTDIVDGTGVATCLPTSRSVFDVGKTTVTCTAVDAHGNVAEPVTFIVTLESIEASNGNAFILVTGGEVIDLDCNTRVVIDGIKVLFHNLCEEQASIRSLDTKSLPGALPAGMTFVTGVDIVVLDGNKQVNPLPANAGIEMHFSASGKDNFAVLFWNGGEWIEITQSLPESGVTDALETDAVNELYRIVSTGKGLFKSLTTEDTGTFILVKK